MIDKKKKIKVALVGNPNCGKTTLFNLLTGSNQYVGNWPGVTVVKKTGEIKFENYIMKVIDLPGIYSLSPYSQEELVSRECIMEDNPDIIINIVDLTNIERNLYLTTQLAELSKPMVIALNMADVLEKKGEKFNKKLLESELKLPMVMISASKGNGIDKLLILIKELAESNYKPICQNIYEERINEVITEIQDVIGEKDSRFNAVKIFENDIDIIKKFNFNEEQTRKINSYRQKIKTTKNVDREMIIADSRYKYICNVCIRVMNKKHFQNNVTLSDKIDKIATNRFLAIPIFLFLMLFIFFVTFGPIGNYLRFLVDNIITKDLAKFILSQLEKLSASEWAKSLVVDGVLAGVGSVVAFSPQIIILFTFLSFLEDSGYMARAAFIMDHLLRKIGLSGKAFVPMFMGFGCTVPAVLATNALDNKRDKRLAILITPFMSCSAKMPVYAVFISAFFANNQPFVIFSIYLLGIIIAILTGLIFKDTLLKGNVSPFVMELPQYRLPTAKSISLHVWERLRDFLLRAVTVLLGASIIIWFLQSFNTNFEFIEDSSNSILAMIGTTIAPVFSLCGFGNWKSAVSLISGVIGKEFVVATMNVLYSGDLNNILPTVFSPLSAYAFMVFVLLYTPCIAALSAIGKEMHSVKWTILAIIYQLGVAWLVSTIVYQFGLLFSRIDAVILFLAIIFVFLMIFMCIHSIKNHKCPPCSGNCSKCGKNKF